MTTIVQPQSDRLPRALASALLVNALWINASEICRYFVFVMPMMREALPELPGVAPMNLGVFLVWGAWDTVLLLVVTGFSWLFLERFGPGRTQALIAGTLVWLAVFVIFWIAVLNMALANSAVLAFALPLSWLEMVVAAFITRWAMRHAPTGARRSHAIVQRPG